MMVLPPIITIDGPSGVGKGTLSKVLSKTLKWNILDSGVIYRALAVEALIHNIVVDDNHKKILIEIAENLNINMLTNEYGGLDFSLSKKSDNFSIDSEIVGNLASKLAVFPEVRRVLLRYQRDCHRFPGLVANGRDMGTVVFPDACLKVFLDASFKVRCQRRLNQLKKKGIYVNYNCLLKTIKERDNRDYTRDVAPLVPARDSLVFNSTYLALHEIVYAVLKCFYNSHIW